MTTSLPRGLDTPLLPGLFALACLAAVDGIAAQTARIVPAVAARADGNQSLPVAFTSTAFRFQQIVDGRAIAPASATIQWFALRADAGALPLNTVVLPNVTVQLSETTTSTLGMGEGFAQNVTRTPTTVFQGPMLLPAQAAVPSGGAPFAIQVPLSQPFTLQTSANRNLLIDIIATDSIPAPTGYSIDAAITGGTIETIGRNGTLGTGDNLNFVAYGQSGPRSIAPGGIVELATTTTFSSYPGALLVGFQPMVPALDLGPFGAPGNVVHVAGIGAAPHVWQQTFIGWAAPWTLTLPNDPQIVGASIWAQSVLVERSSNALGLVVTDAKHLLIGDTSIDAMQSVVATDPAQPLGSWAFGATDLGGAAVELSGTFQ